MHKRQNSPAIRLSSGILCAACALSAGFTDPVIDRVRIFLYKLPCPCPFEVLNYIIVRGVRACIPHVCRYGGVEKIWILQDNSPE